MCVLISAANLLQRHSLLVNTPLEVCPPKLEAVLVLLVGKLPTEPPQDHRTYRQFSRSISLPVPSGLSMGRVNDMTNVFPFLIDEILTMFCIVSSIGPTDLLAPFHL